jgi:hypothetical protein
MAVITSFTANPIRLILIWVIAPMVLIWRVINLANLTSGMWFGPSLASKVGFMHFIDWLSRQ